MRPEKPHSLVGEMRFCAVIGEQEDSAFRYFGFHSYSTLKCASSWALSKDVILKCEIPVDSGYYTSITTEEYCSIRIRVIAWRKASEKKRHR